MSRRGRHFSNIPPVLPVSNLSNQHTCTIRSFIKQLTHTFSIFPTNPIYVVIFKYVKINICVYIILNVTSDVFLRKSERLSFTLL